MNKYRDSQYRFKERAVDLVSRMTNEEKISQLGSAACAIERLGIPAYDYWSEASHGQVGFMRSELMDVTSVPVCLAMSHTWSPEMVKEATALISDEGRAYHNLKGYELHFWCPTLNLGRDPRWGRNDENMGEDPFLEGKLAAAYVSGMQGDDAKYLKTVATVKHFAANNSEYNRHTGSSNMDEATLREYYCKPFEYAVREGKAASVMTSYNRVNGIPASANEHLLEDILREEWGFDGFVVSDAGAITDVSGKAGEHGIVGHGYVPNMQQGCAVSIKAGTDMSCGSEYTAWLKTAVEEGLLSWNDIDKAVIRVMESRIRLGLMDEHPPFSELGADDICTPQSREIAEKLAQESIVLLKNNGILPINATKVRKVLVVGPNAIYRQLGGYSCGDSRVCDTKYFVSPLNGIQTAAGEAQMECVYTKGWNLNENYGKLAMFLPGQEVGEVTGDLSGLPAAIREMVLAAARTPVRWKACDREKGMDDEALLEKAVEEAKNADMVIVIAGSDDTNGTEENDRRDLSLPYGQDEKICRICEANKNTVVVLVCGGPVTGKFLDKVPAVVAAYYAGQEQGTGIASVLFGSHNPSGKLTQTWYQSEEDLPHISEYALRPCETMTGKGRTYQYFTGTARYPFGYGLSYTNYAYNHLVLSNASKEKSSDGILPEGTTSSSVPVVFDANDTVRVTFEVTNTGSRAGTEISQIYIRKNPSREAMEHKPLRQLKGFARTWLEAGETKTVTVDIPLKECAFWSNTYQKYMVEEGVYTVYAGTNSGDLSCEAQFQVNGRWKAQLSTFTAEPEKFMLKAGEQTNLKCHAVLEDAQHLDEKDIHVKYTSTDTSVAEVNEDGTIYAAAVGTAAIICQCSFGGVTKVYETAVAVQPNC